jgi:hypothetical protein
VAIYLLGLVYSLPRFFEYKTELRREILTVSENVSENHDHLVIKNKLHNSTIYQYTVHLSKQYFRNLFIGECFNVLF